MKSLLTTILALFLLAGGIILGAFPIASTEAATNNACTAVSTPFGVTQAFWGTVGAPQSVYPGAVDVPLTFTIVFGGPCTSPVTDFELPLGGVQNTSPFTGAGGVTDPENVDVTAITPNTLVSQTFYVNVPQNTPPGTTFHVPLSITYQNNTATSVLNQFIYATITLFGPAQITFSASNTRLVAGEQNNVTVSISNTGTGDAGPVSTTVTAPSAITLFNQLPATGSLSPGQNASGTIQMFVPSSESGGAFVLTFTSKFLDSYGISQTVTQTIGFTVPEATTVQPTAQFTVEGANWGSATSTASPLPGTQDEPLVVSLQYLGSTAVTSLEGTLQLPAGMTNINGGSTATAYSASTTNQYGAVALTFYVDLEGSAKAGSYDLALNLQWMTSQSLGLTETATITPPPLALLQSSFQVDSAVWQKSSTNSTTLVTTSTAVSPEPGDLDVPLVVSLQYLGTTTASDIEGTLSLPTGFTDLNGNPTATAFSATASANEVISLTFDVNVADSVKPGSYSFPVELSWVTSVGIGLTQSATASPPPVAAATAAASFPLSIVQENSSVTAGGIDSAAFTLTNDGTQTITSPTFSLVVGSPVVISSIGSPVPVSELAPGANATFTARLTSGPSATPGIYTGTLSVTFTDSSGTTHSQSFPLSFTVEGTVVLILQDTSVSQSLTGFTVTGSILNEGSVAAYYASVSGLIAGSRATPVYLGEIDPNTPTPFSVTIPFTAPTTIGSSSSTTVTRTGSRSFSFSGAPGGNFSRSFTFNGTLPAGITGAFNGTAVPRNGTSTATTGAATVALTLTYQDTFGNAKASSFSLATTIKSASELGGSTSTALSTGTSSNSELTDVAYGVVGLVIATIVVGAVMVRKYRSDKLGNLPTEDKSVI